MLLELHCHSWYSQGTRITWEGLDSPEKMIKRAKMLGIEGIAITDHNVLTRVKADDILVIPGMEVTVNSNGKEKHIIALGIEDEIPSQLSVRETIDRIHEQGGLAVACHPFDVYGKGIRSEAKFCDAIEVFNPLNQERISNWKARRLARKFNLPEVAGSDAHCVEMLGYGLTDVPSATDVDSVLKAIKKGRTRLFTKYYSIPTLVNWYTIRLRLSYFDVLKYLDTKGKLKKVAGKNLLKLIRKSPGRVDYLFRGIAYIGLGGAFIYSLARGLTS